MEIQVRAGNIIDSQADTLVCAVYDGEPALGTATQTIDAALSGGIRDLQALGDLTGKTGQTVVVYPRGAIAASRVILIGMGKRDELTADTIRKASAAGMKKARELKAFQVATVVPGAGTAGLSVMEAAQAFRPPRRSCRAGWPPPPLAAPSARDWSWTIGMVSWRTPKHPSRASCA